VTDSGVINRMRHAIDRLDWATVRDSFTEVIVTDYMSPWGGEPETLPAEGLISRPSAFASGRAATQHQTGPVVVTAGRAATHVDAYHGMPDGDLWTVHGHCVARITEGRIAERTRQTFYAAGSEALLAIAARRHPMAAGSCVPRTGRLGGRADRTGIARQRHARPAPQRAGALSVRALRPSYTARPGRRRAPQDTCAGCREETDRWDALSGT
jgi:hypothetical protein